MLTISGNYISLTLDPIQPLSRDYRIFISIEDSINLSEPILITLPLPNDFSDKYSEFKFTQNDMNYSKYDELKDNYFNYSIISTDYGKMLSIVTNESLKILTRLKFDSREIVFEDKISLTTQRNNTAMINLANTSANVSLNLYYETEYSVGLVFWEFRYIAIGNEPPNFQSSYHDGTYNEMIDARNDYENHLLQIKSGWNNLSLFNGKYTRST